jgi:DNA-binding CsgD family transcriptional regulator
VRAVRTVDLPEVELWVGRTTELEVVRAAGERLGRGKGGVLWVEGEPGIGKSSLLAMGLGRESTAEFDVWWATADQLLRRFPLAVMQACLGVGLRSPDPRRTRTADLLHRRREAPAPAGPAADLSYADVDVLVSLVGDLCTDRPTALVLDDVQWADNASLAVWHRLAHLADQWPLLMVASCRPVALTPPVLDLCAAVGRRGGNILSLGPLTGHDVHSLVSRRLGATAGPRLSSLVAQAQGNPLYVRELLDALVREDQLIPGRDGVDVPEAAVWRLPASFTAIIEQRLRVLSEETGRMLRAAALLGGTFTVGDLASVLETSPSGLTAGLMEAVAAGIVVDAGPHLLFRHQLIRQALHDRIPAALRVALHRQAALTLAAAGAEPVRVAEQLLASGQPGDVALRGWLAGAGAVLTRQAPQLAVEVLQREVDYARSKDRFSERLAAGLAGALFAAGRYAEAAAHAARAVAGASDPDHRAEAYWLRVRALAALGSHDEMAEVIQHALSWPDLPKTWRGRLLARQAMVQRASDGDLARAEATAHDALGIASGAGDRYAMAYALTDLWLILGVRRDHGGALRHLDRALAILADDPDNVDLRAFVFDGRVFSLQNLGRWDAAEATLKEARDLAERTGYASPNMHIAVAVYRYWVGQWEEAMAELEPDPQGSAEFTYSGLREAGPALLRQHGVAALIAARRHDRKTAAEHLRRGLSLPCETVAARENCDFLLAARAVTLEQSGAVAQAAAVLSTAVRRGAGEMTLTHQWLPDLVRLCLAAGDQAAAAAALSACQEEGEAETIPARAAAAAARCRGIFHNDPDPLHEAVQHYRRVGAPVELAATLEDLAVVTAVRGDAGEARRLLNECTSLYDTMGAEWDVRRAASRLRQYGIRRGVRGPRRHQRGAGWEALTPTEEAVAGMLGDGLSTESIARQMLLSRRTVQTHISHILRKIGAESRLEIAREAYRRTR